MCVVLHGSMRECFPRFDFGLIRNGVEASTILNGLGFVLENNGELRFYPTSGAASPAVSSTTTTSQPHHHHQLKSVHNSRLLAVKEELDDADVFLSPTTLPAANPLPRLKRPRPRPDPLFIPMQQHPRSTPRGPALYKSRLRSPRMKMISSQLSATPPFTPPPMLDPGRTAAGLYNTLQLKSAFTKNY